MVEKIHNCQQCGTEIGFEGICYDCRAENARNETLALTPAEVNQKIAQICTEISETGKLEQNDALFKRLVNFRDINTEKIAEAAFAKNLFYPFEIYKDAPDYILEKMIDKLHQKETTRLQAIWLLSCLAIHGGEKVFQTFLEAEADNTLREKLKARPVLYTTVGGWTYDQDQKYKKLIFDTCFPIVEGTSAEKELSPVKVCTKSDACCPRCQCQMIHLLELDGRDERLNFLGIDGLLKVKYCLNCLFYFDNAYYRYTLDGKSEPILDETFDQPNELILFETPEETFSNTYVLGKTPVPLRYAADWEGGSAVGGFAFWIQDAEICTCPDCGQPMQYLAQIQWDKVIDSMEGNAYIEVCKECQIVTVLHQQT